MLCSLFHRILWAKSYIYWKICSMSVGAVKEYLQRCQPRLSLLQAVCLCQTQRTGTRGPHGRPAITSGKIQDLCLCPHVAEKREKEISRAERVCSVAIEAVVWPGEGASHLVSALATGRTSGFSWRNSTTPVVTARAELRLIIPFKSRVLITWFAIPVWKLWRCHPQVSIGSAPKLIASGAHYCDSGASSIASGTRKSLGKMIACEKWEEGQSVKGAAFPSTMESVSFITLHHSSWSQGPSTESAVNLQEPYHPFPILWRKLALCYQQCKETTGC